MTALKFTPSNVEGFSKCTEAFVYPDRLELFSVTQTKSFTFLTLLDGIDVAGCIVHWLGSVWE